MRKIIAKSGIVFLFVGVVFSLAFAQETLTISTYYPSPYGSYNELQLNPHTPAVTACDATGRGTMYYDSTLNEVRVCDGANYSSLSTTRIQRGRVQFPPPGAGPTTYGFNFIKQNYFVSAPVVLVEVETTGGAPAVSGWRTLDASWGAVPQTTIWTWVRNITINSFDLVISTNYASPGNWFLNYIAVE